MKAYVTYKRVKIDEKNYIDPSTNNGVTTMSDGKIIYHETPYEVNGVFISWIEYGLDVSPEMLTGFAQIEPRFEFTIVTEGIINNMLLTFGEDENGPLVSVSDFVFTDRRVIDLPSLR